MPDVRDVPLGQFLPGTNAAVLVVLTVVVQVAAIWVVADPLQAPQAPAPVQSAENEAGTALPVLAFLLVELVFVIGAWYVFQRLPAWARRWLTRGGIGIGLVYAVAYAWVIMPVLFAVYGLITVAYLTGYRWVAYNIGGLTIGVIIAGTLGGYFGPVPLVVLLAALMAYDWVAVIETDIMDRLVRVLTSTGLPVLVVVPKRLDFDFEGFLEALGDGGIDIGDWSDRVHSVIGIGDFAIPAALAAAAFRFYGPAVASTVLLGTVVGMLLLTGELGDDALPGLPWLGGGAISGYVVGVLWLHVALLT